MSDLSDALYEAFSWLPNTPPPEDRQRVAKAIATALAAPSSESPAATGSGAAPTRDAVAEVLLHEAHPDLAPWSLLQLSGHNAAGIVAAVALARRQADAVMARWSAPPAPRGEAVAWFVEDKDGYAPTRPTFDEFEADAERRELDRTDPENAPHRVVALVPKHEEEAP